MGVGSGRPRRWRDPANTPGAQESHSRRAGVAQRLEQPLYKGLNRVELPAPVPPVDAQSTVAVSDIDDG